jgi:tetratricopeptide (TPR) repeat protein
MAPYLGLGLAAVVLAYLPAVFGAGYYSDDQGILQATPYFSQGLSGLWKLWTTGYWQGAQGSTAAIHYYRPVLTTTFWLTGLSLPLGRLINVALHAAAAVLLRNNLRRRMNERAADAAALFWALSPMHVEAVAQLSGRSEVLAGLCMLGSWYYLDSGRRAYGLALFTGALLSKETAFFFPLFYALVGRKRKELFGLGLCAAAVLGARALVLDGLVEGGVSYFDSRWTALRTIPKFWIQEYLFPALTGLGGCSDYSRPYFSDVSSWLYLPVLLLMRSPFFIFLIPGSHVLMPVDTIGAQRWLYLPLAGLATGLARWPVLALALAVYSGARTFVKAGLYGSSETYYAAAVSCNPGSARAWSSWAAPALERGDSVEGRRRLQKALSLQPNLPTPHYNLGRLAYEEGKLKEAETHLRRSLELQPNADAYILAGLVARGLGKDPRPHFDSARRLVPNHPLLK